MAKFNFNLRDASAKEKTPIYLIVRNEKKKLDVLPMYQYIQKTGMLKPKQPVKQKTFVML